MAQCNHINNMKQTLGRRKKGLKKKEKKEGRREGGKEGKE